MQINQKAKSKTLRGVTDLTLVATIRRELIPALDSRSYESRLRLLLRTLNTLRVSSLEAEPTPLINDVVDRIRAIHSFRLAIVPASLTQPRALLVLAVAFDGGWEPYMRRIWRDLGPLLDVIFCNCEGYLGAHDHSFAEYAGWVRSAQVETEFFYNASALTVNDLHYVRETERQRADRVKLPEPEGDAFEQALLALTALYRLTDMYPYPLPDGSADGKIMLRAALHLLSEQEDVLRKRHPLLDRTPNERAALEWFVKAEEPKKKQPVAAAWDPTKVQGGIVKPYEGVTHGCLLLVELLDAAAARALLEYARPIIMNAGAQRTALYSACFVNLGFTLQGLQIAGVPEATLDQLPFEFREGMSARAGILGDLLDNHPTRWSLPERNWPASSGQGRVQMSSVHAIVQFTCRDKSSLDWQTLVGNKDHPLSKLVSDFDHALGDKRVRILSVQAMQRYVRDGEQLPRGHFGFVDGISQPSLEPDPASWTSRHSDQVLLGDLLLGYDNSLGDRPLTGRLWDDSTFLVIRKLSQHVEALSAVLPKDGAKANFIKSRLMGRGVDGENLIDPRRGTTNDFDYKDDPDGRKCPFQSHVRRANPRIARDSRPDLRTVPRIIRRGMSYGPLPDATHANAERGLVFMAYNASIAEQFEVIQAWLSGGNSGSQHTYSALRDPLLGVALDDDPRTFVFQDENDGQERLNMASDRPFVKLEWGVYVFVPSIKALGELQDIAKEAAAIESKDPDKEAQKKKDDQRAIELAVQASKGAAVIARLLVAEQALGFEAAKEQWKIALEDMSARMSGLSQCVWAAIRQLHGGVLRTPYGVLVCSKERVMEVFQNTDRRYTASGYAERMRKSFGEIFLGLDEGPQYHRKADKVDEAIWKVDVASAFNSAFGITNERVKHLVGTGSPVQVEVKDLVDDILAMVSKEWFGLPDGVNVVEGGWNWRANVPPTCPGHFHSPSRYMFQPNPGEAATKTGEDHGRALNTAVKKFVESHCKADTTPDGQLGQALFDAIPPDADDEKERLSRTLIGVMMGFLPTVDGNLRGVLFEWISDGSLWNHQNAYLADARTPPLDRATNALMEPLQRTLLLRPVPELTWRTALAAHRLGPVDIVPGEKVVVSIVSATQECLIDDDLDLYPIFGGDRDAVNPPTHACPGYKMAVGVMLGVLAGLVESAEMKPTMSPMALSLSIRP